MTFIESDQIGWTEEERQAPFDFAQGRLSDPPDFLLRSVALASFMRLSLLKAAHVGAGECRVAGNPGALRPG